MASFWISIPKMLSQAIFQWPTKKSTFVLMCASQRVEQRWLRLSTRKFPVLDRGFSSRDECFRQRVGSTSFMAMNSARVGVKCAFGGLFTLLFIPKKILVNLADRLDGDDAEIKHPPVKQFQLAFAVLFSTKKHSLILKQIIPVHRLFLLFLSPFKLPLNDSSNFSK